MSTLHVKVYFIKHHVPYTGHNKILEMLTQCQFVFVYWDTKARLIHTAVLIDIVVVFVVICMQYNCHCQTCLKDGPHDVQYKSDPLLVMTVHIY